MREFFRHADDVSRSGLKGDLEGKRVIVQGLGNVGFHAARCLTEEEGVRLIGVIEHDGAVLSDTGLAPKALAEHLARTGGVGGFPGARFVADGASVLEAECDILIPARHREPDHRGQRTPHPRPAHRRGRQRSR